MTSPDDPTALGWELLETFEKDRDERRAHPDRFLAEVAADLWRGMDEDEAFDDFAARARLVPWWATDVVECFERSLRELPDRVPQILQDGGVWTGATAEEQPETYRDFLRRQLERMRPVLDGLKQPPA